MSQVASKRLTETRQSRKLRVLARGIEVYTAVLIADGSVQLKSDNNWSSKTTHEMTKVFYGMTGCLQDFT